MDSSYHYGRKNSLQSLSKGNNDNPSFQSVRSGNSSLSHAFTPSKPFGYSEQMANPSQPKWRKQEGNNKCMTINISRNMRSEEISLFQKVANSFDNSINIIVNQNDTKRIFVVYDSDVHPCILNAIHTLINEVDEIYRNEPAREIPTEDPKPSPLPEANIPPEVQPAVDATAGGEEASENAEVFERPLSLKGQRHVFLYKCRYGQLKSIIEKSGCWGLRMASLEDKWPCLVVYCAKDRESWMNAFRKIQKLERTDFLRKKVSDSLKNVDLKRLEELTQSYGQKNACISLCVQSPSSPENPSVSVCGLEPFVEQLFKIFVEYHLVSEELTESSMDTKQVYNQNPYGPMGPSNDIFFPTGNHHLYTPYTPTGFITQDMGTDIHDNYNTTFNNPYFDNYPYSRTRHDPISQQKNLIPNRSLSLRERFRDDPFFLDNEHYFPSSPLPYIPETEERLNQTSLLNEPSEPDPMLPTNYIQHEESPTIKAPRLEATSFTEFFPATVPTQEPKPKPKPKPNPKPMPKPIIKTDTLQPKERVLPSLREEPKQPPAKMNEIPSLTSWGDHEEPATRLSRLRHRDDNFELFMDSNGYPDHMGGVMSNALSFNSQWRDDGW